MSSISPKSDIGHFIYTANGLKAFAGWHNSIYLYRKSTDLIGRETALKKE